MKKCSKNTCQIRRLLQDWTYILFAKDIKTIYLFFLFSGSFDPSVFLTHFLDHGKITRQKFSSSSDLFSLTLKHSHPENFQQEEVLKKRPTGTVLSHFLRNRVMQIKKETPLRFSLTWEKHVKKSQKWHMRCKLIKINTFTTFSLSNKVLTSCLCME